MDEKRHDGLEQDQITADVVLKTDVNETRRRCKTASFRGVDNSNRRILTPTFLSCASVTQSLPYIGIYSRVALLLRTVVVSFANFGTNIDNGFKVKLLSINIASLPQVF